VEEKIEKRRGIYDIEVRARKGKYDEGSGSERKEQIGRARMGYYEESSTRCSIGKQA
jgi:hypothetical protein